MRAPARAELTWEKKVVQARADAGSGAVVEARYPFKNTSSVPVEIRSVQTSCGCTTAELPKQIYAPGEQGEIVVRFTIGDRVGLQKKSVYVMAADPDDSTALTLIVDIPELVHLQPAFITWFQGEEKTPKIFSLDALPGTPPISNVRIESNTATMTAELRAVEAGKRYQLVVTPQQTERLTVATLTISCRFDVPPASAGARPAPGGRTLKAFALVKPRDNG